MSIASLDVVDLDVADVYAALGGDAGSARRRGLETFARCLRHTPDRHPSLRWNAAKGTWRCDVCDKDGGVFDLVVFAGAATSRAEAATWLRERGHLADRAQNGTRLHTPRRASPRPLPANIPPPQLEPSDREKMRARLRDATPLIDTVGDAYLRGRCLEIDGAANDVGYHPAWYGRGPAVLFKIRDAARGLVAVQGRFIDPRTLPKTQDVGRKSFGVYATAGALDAPLVAIAEGPISALSIAECGLPAVATMGVEAPAWLRRTLAFRTVVLASDHDEAGEAFALRLRAMLTLGTRCLRLALPTADPEEDVNDVLQRDPAALNAAISRIVAEYGSRIAPGRDFGASEVSNYVPEPQTLPGAAERLESASIDDLAAVRAAAERAFGLYFGGEGVNGA